jgi:hypothetical protein
MEVWVLWLGDRGSDKWSVRDVFDSENTDLWQFILSLRAPVTSSYCFHLDFAEIVLVYLS